MLRPSRLLQAAWQTAPRTTNPYDPKPDWQISGRSNCAGCNTCDAATVLLAPFQAADSFINRVHGRPFQHQPRRCAVVAGLDEADSLLQTLDSLSGAYPDLQTVVVDGGSTDGMSDVACKFAKGHPKTTVVRKPPLDAVRDPVGDHRGTAIRRSYPDNFVTERVRNVTWHW